MSRSRVAPVAFAAGALLLTRFVACTPTPTPDGPSPPPSPTLDGAIVAPPKDAGPKVDGAMPPANPFADWVRWTDFDPSCENYVPPSPSRMPAPYQWEPCEPAPETAGLDCRRAKIDWVPETFVGYYYGRTMSRPGGALAIATTLSTEHGHVDMISDLDGPTRFALLQKDVNHCRLDAFSGRGDRFGYAMLTTQAGKPTQDALVGGELADGKLRILQAYKEPDIRTIHMGDDGYIERDGPLTVIDWATGKRGETIFSPTGSALFNPVYQNGIVSFETGSRAYQSIWTYIPANKSQLFRSFGEDDTRAASDLGTDGVDWVWVEGYGRPTASSDPYPQVRIVTSKVIPGRGGPPENPREVRAGFYGSPFGTTPWTVGCGYAARTTTVRDAGGILSQPVVLVRLSDGKAHRLETRSTNKSAFGAAIGLTCNELVLRGTDTSADGKRRQNIFRIRIDSLGPDRELPPPTASDAGL